MSIVCCLSVVDCAVTTNAWQSINKKIKKKNILFINDGKDGELL
jgi:hypothetical protein